MIETIQAFAVEPPLSPQKWAPDVPAQKPTFTVVRITDDSGIEGIGSTGTADPALLETLRTLAPRLLGEDPRRRESLWHELRDAALPMLRSALAALDIALWDIAARLEDQPLYRMLGGAESSYPAYASTLLLDDPAAYIELVRQVRDAGFTAVKFHAWCEPDRDLQMLREVRHAFPELTLMHDADERYDRQPALRVARELEALDFRWLEAPLPDHDVEGYAKLRASTALEIVPDGNTVLDLQQIRDALLQEPWDAVRFDVTAAGGITPAKEIAALAASRGLRIELQSWGFTPMQLANLHLALGVERTGYFELPVPYEPYEFAACNPVRPDALGRVHPPDAPGLGLDLDWERLRASARASFTCDRDCTQ